MAKSKVDIHSISSMRKAGILVSSEGIMLTEEEAASRMAASRAYFKELYKDMQKAMEGRVGSDLKLTRQRPFC